MNAIVFGASGGIGRAVCEALLSRGGYETIFAVSRQRDLSILQASTTPRSEGATSTLQPLVCDLTDEASLRSVAARVEAAGPLTLCLCAIGKLSDADSDLTPERSLQSQSQAAFETLFHTNAILPALIAKHMMPLMPRTERAVFAALSARVGSISDNRLGGWHAYRASKAALNMLIRNFAIEQARRAAEFIAVGLHPGTVDTALSLPFQRNVPKGKLFTPHHAATCLLDVVEGLRPDDSGKVFDWQGKEIPA